MPYKFPGRILFPLVILVAVLFAVTGAIRLRLILNKVAVVNALSNEDGPPATYRQADLVNAYYPYPWQQEQREKLTSLLRQPDTPPSGTDAFSLARYAQYMLLLPATAPGYERLAQDGMRRDPENALYHYLLADYLLQKALAGDPPARDKQTGVVTFHYTVRDRQLLDRAMHELAIGTVLPYHPHRIAILRAQLNALPEPHHMEDWLLQESMLADIRYPENAIFRNFERVNSYYLSLLLSEGRRKDAEPFLHTGERLVLQLSRDDQPTMIGLFVSLAISIISSNNDAWVCRQYGYAQEANALTQRHTVLMGKVNAWRDNKKQRDLSTSTIRQSGELARSQIPVFGKQNWLTAKILAPSRLLEYTVIEEVIATQLSALLFLFFCFAALRSWYWGRVARVASAAPEEAGLSRKGWYTVTLLGLVLPLVSILLCSAIPATSWKGLGLAFGMYSFISVVVPALLCVLVIPVIVPPVVVWRRHVVARQEEITSGGKAQGTRIFASVLTFFWMLLPVVSLLLIPFDFFSQLVVNKPFSSPDAETSLFLTFFALLPLLLELLILPALTKKKRAHMAAYYHALSRTMLQVYAVFFLLTATFYPALCIAERHYLRTDKVLGVMQEGDTIAITYVEGRQVQRLRGFILEGAEKLGMK